MSAPNSPRSVTVSARLPHELALRVRACAWDNHRTPSSEVRHLVEAGFKNSEATHDGGSAKTSVTALDDEE
jgi:predicted DNA-binding protein